MPLSGANAIRDSLRAEYHNNYVLIEPLNLLVGDYLELARTHPFVVCGAAEALTFVHRGCSLLRVPRSESVAVWLVLPPLMSQGDFAFEVARALELMLTAAPTRPPTRCWSRPVGRPRVADRHPDFLRLLHDYLVAEGALVDPRIGTGTMYFGQRLTLGRVQEAVSEMLDGVPVSRSVIYTYLSPARRGTVAARRHHSDALDVRCRRSTKDGRDSHHIDAHFCAWALRAAIWLGHAVEADILSCDDKARLPVVGPPTAGRSAPEWAARSTSVHDFAQTKAVSITLSGTMLLSRPVLDATVGTRAASARTGPCAYTIKAATVKSTLMHHLDSLLEQLEAGHVELTSSFLILLVDGGSDYTPAHQNNRRLYALLAQLLDLDWLVVLKSYPQGGSKLNPIERAHARINAALSGAGLISACELADVYKVSPEKAVPPDVAAALLTEGQARAKRLLEETSYGGARMRALIRGAGTNTMLPADLDVGLLDKCATRGKVALPERLQQLRARLRLPPAAHIDLDVTEKLFDSPTHSVSLTHAFIFTKCDTGTCGLHCPRRALDEGAAEPAVLGASPNRLALLSRFLTPVAVQGNSGEYVSVEQRLAQLLSGDSLDRLQPAPAPSATLHALAREPISDDEFRKRGLELALGAAALNEREARAVIAQAELDRSRRKK